MVDSHIKEQSDAHQDACDNEEYFYIDPETGLFVQTAYGLALRGSCCNNSCRHCPWEVTSDA